MQLSLFFPQVVGCKLPCSLKKVLGSKSSGSKPSASSQTSFSWFWLPCKCKTGKSEETRQQVAFPHSLLTEPMKCEWTSHTYRVVDFGVVSVLLLHLLIVLLLFFPLVLIQRLQVFPSVVFLHHFIPFELVVPLFVVVLQVFGGLDLKRKHIIKSAHPTVVVLTSKFSELALKTSALFTDLISKSRSSTSKVWGFMWFKYSNCFSRAWWSTAMSIKE